MLEAKTCMLGVNLRQLGDMSLRPTYRLYIGSCASMSTKLRPTDWVQHTSDCSTRWHVDLGDICECTGVFCRNSAKKSDFVSIIKEIPYSAVADVVWTAANLVISTLPIDQTWSNAIAIGLLRLLIRLLPNWPNSFRRFCSILEK